MSEVQILPHGSAHLTTLNRKLFSLAVKKTAISKSKQCGLVFPVGRVHRLLKTSRATRVPRISVSAAVYLASVLEYLTSSSLLSLIFLMGSFGVY